MINKTPDSYAFNLTREVILATEVKLANTHYTRLRGLLGANSATFSSGRALWIVPCRCIHTIGMKFAIDAIFLDRGNRVVHTEENIKPWRMTPLCASAVSVLELPNRTISRTSTAVGDLIEIAKKEASHE